MRSNARPAGSESQAVGEHDLDIVEPERREPRGGLDRERLAALERKHLARHLREQRGGVAGAGADLEHPRARP